MSQNNTMTLKNGKNSVEKAIELLSNESNNDKGKKRQKVIVDTKEKTRQMISHCTSTKEKKSTSIPFAKSLALTEMRTLIARHDWIHLQQLFPILLNYSNEIESVVWRYLMSILLYSPYSNSTTLQQFFELCLGCQDSNIDLALEKLLILSKTD